MRIPAGSNQETLCWQWCRLLYYPDWELLLSRLEPILPMRIPIGPNQETLCWQWCRLLYYPDWELLLSRLEPILPTRIPIGPNQETLYWQWFYPDLVIPLSWSERFSPNEDNNESRKWNSLLTTTHFVPLTRSLSNKLSQLGDTYILNEANENAFSANFSSRNVWMSWAKLCTFCIKIVLPSIKLHPILTFWEWYFSDLRRQVAV